jgi:N-acetylmuramoyl-L-alanine amidase
MVRWWMGQSACAAHGDTGLSCVDEVCRRAQARSHLARGNPALASGCARSDSPFVLEVANALRKAGQPAWVHQFDDALGIYRFDELVVLRSTRMPALLFEAGVIVNRDEEKLLRSPRHQKKLAAALTEAVVDFCEGSPVPPAPQPDCR